MDEKTRRFIMITTPVILAVIIMANNRDFFRDNHLLPQLILIFVALFSIIANWITVNPESFFTFFLRILTILLFLTTFTTFVVSLLFPELLGLDVTEHKEIQIFACVVSAGAMGGLMRYLMEEKVQNGSSIDLWLLSLAAVSGLFVSVIMFLVLRAGVINKVQIDTFNVYGVSGISAVIGFFADKMVKRFSSLYEEVLGRPKDDN